MELVGITAKQIQEAGRTEILTDKKVAAVLKGRTVYVDRRGVGYVSDRIGTIAGHRTGGMDADTLCYVILDNFIGLALIEELCKMQAAKWAAWKHPAFNY